MNAIVVETMAEAHAIAAAVGPGWQVVHLGEPAYLQISHPKWWLDPQVTVPAAGTRHLTKVLESGDVKKLYISMPPTLQGDASADAIVSWLDVTMNGTKPKVFQVDLSKSTLSGIIKELSGASEYIKGSAHETYRWAATLDGIISQRVSVVLSHRFSYRIQVDRLQAFCLHMLSKRERGIRAETPVPMWHVETILDNGLVCLSEACDFRGKAERYSRWLQAGEFRLQSKTTHGQIPAPEPFTILGLLDEANRRWGFTFQQVTEAAMRLYGDGAITHPWTMGTQVGSVFQRNVGVVLKQRGLGRHFLPTSAGAGAMAIVPRDVSVLPRDGMSKPRRNMAAPTAHVYDMIWHRAVASQMKAAAVIDQHIRLVPLSSDRVMGTITGRKIQDAGFSVIEPLDSLPEIGTSKIKSVQIVETSVYSARYTERQILDTMVSNGVNTQDATLTLLHMWNNGHMVAHGSNVAPSPSGEVISSFLERAMPFLAKAGLMRSVSEGTAKIAAGGIQGRRWVQGFVQKVLAPALSVASNMPIAENPPHSMRSIAPYGVVITETGPYFYDPTNKDAINIEVGPDGQLVPFKARPTPGVCKVCSNTVLMLSRTQGSDYIYCAACGAKAES